MRKKALLRREQDPSYAWITVDTCDVKSDSKLSKSRSTLTSLNTFVTEQKRMR